MKTARLFPVLLVAYEICCYLSNDMYLPALPEMADALQLTHHTAQLTLTSWFLGATSIQLLLGPISDRYGRRPILLLGGLVYIATNIICATTTNIHYLLITRFIQGSCVCSVVVAGYAAIHELYEQREAVQILALMGSIVVLAPAFGPLGGSVILQFASWRAIFWFIGILSAILILSLYVFMPETRPRHTSQPLSLSKLASDYYAIMTNKGFAYNTFAFCFLFIGTIGWIAMGSFLSIDAFSYSPMAFALFQVIIFSGFILGSHMVKYGIVWWGISKMIVVGLSIGLCGALASMITSWMLPHHFFLFILTLTVFTSGTALAFGALSRIAIEACQEPMGARMAIFSTMMSGAATVSSMISGALYNGTTLTLAMIIMASCVLACCMRASAHERTSVSAVQ